MRKSKVLTSIQWPSGLEPLKMWLVAQGVDLALRRHESEVLELVRLISHIRFSPKQRSKSVRGRMFLAQNRLCWADVGSAQRAWSKKDFGHAS